MRRSSVSRQACSCGESTSTPSTSKMAPRTGASRAGCGLPATGPAYCRPGSNPDACEHAVILDATFPVEAWALRESELRLDLLPQTESLFALANGHVGLRGNLDEGEPHGIPGSYVGGVYELRPLPYAEAGYSYPEAGQTVVNVTNGKLMRLLVDDEPFDVRYGELRSHERVLDLRSGLLDRRVEWTS